MTLSHICDSVEDDFWLRSTDHRTVHFVNRSSEWLELKGSMQMGTHRNMSAISRIPPKAIYTHRFVGETFDGDPSRWMEFGLMELVCCAPDPYWFCFQNDYKWTCKVIKPLKWMKKNDFPNNIINNESSAAFQCKLNGKACLHLNQDLGEKMKALESKTVYIDVKFVSSLQSMAFLAVLSPLEQTKVSNNNLDLPLPQKMKDELGELLSLKRSINLNNNF